MSLLASARAVIFDMDGVLWHSERAHAAAYAAVLEANGLPSPPYAELAGRRTTDVMRDLLGGHGDEAQVARLTREKRTRARELLAEAPPLDPAATALIASLSADQRLGLASSASRASVELYLDASALRERFHVVLSGEDVARAKPDPEIYLSACEALGVAPSEAVIFEDSLSGVAAGVGAGSRVIGVASSRPKEELLAAGAVAAVSDLWEAAAL